MLSRLPQNFRLLFVVAVLLPLFLNPHFATAQDPDKQKTTRIGIIGLDTSHSIAFTKILNDETKSGKFRVVCAYPHGSADIESSVSRIPLYTKQIKEFGVEVVDSIDELIAQVDVVLLETNDGRVHLEQSIPVLKAGKPVFIDKPVAASLSDVIAIYAAAKHFGTPVFSSSSLRYSKPALDARSGKLVGEVLGCTTFSPAKLEPTHPDLYWYGIHGVEQLFTVMGAGCQSVTRSSTASTDVVVGTWGDGRIGTFRGTRSGVSTYGGTVFGTKGNASTGGYEGYGGLLVEIKKFFETGIPPIDESETIEIYAFMSAADVSKSKNGSPVALADVIKIARDEATSRLEKLGIKTVESQVDCTETDEAIVVTKNGEPFFEYKKSVQLPPEGMEASYKRSGYIHPLRTPSGRVVTGDFASDHAHQHAIFIAWVRTQFKGHAVDFWNQHKGTGRISHAKIDSLENSDQRVGFAAELIHEDITDPETPVIVLREKWRVSVLDRGTEHSVFDLHSLQTCVADSPLVISKNHYGGLGIRGSGQWYHPESEKAFAAWAKEGVNVEESARPAPPNIELMKHEFLTSEGLQRHNGNLTKAKWVAMYGLVDGEWAGIAVLCHPDNFRATQHVRLHPGKPYFSFCPVVEGEFQIEPNETYETRLRLIAFDGKPKTELLNQEWDDFAKSVAE